MSTKSQNERVLGLERSAADKQHCTCSCHWDTHSDFYELGEERARAVSSILESLFVENADGSRTNLLEALPVRNMRCFCSH